MSIPVLTVSTFIDISAKVNDNGDRGLLDIALHPNFGQPVQPGQPEHNYVYAFYVVDPPGTVGNPDPDAGPDGGGNRFAYLVRFTADAATNYTTAVPGSEVILLGGVAVPGVAGLQPRTLQDISGAGAVDSTSNLASPSPALTPKQGNTSITTSRSIRGVMPADRWRLAQTALSMYLPEMARPSTQRTRALSVFRTSTVCQARSCASTHQPAWDSQTTRLSSRATISAPTVPKSTNWA